MPSRKERWRCAYRRSTGRRSAPLAETASNRPSIRSKHRFPGTSSGSIRITVCRVFDVCANGLPVSAPARISIMNAIDEPLWPPNGKSDPPSSIAFGLASAPGSPGLATGLVWLKQTTVCHERTEGGAMLCKR
jgi:hypothetical protein